MATPAALRQPEEKEFAFTERDFQFIAQWVNGKTGIVLSSKKRDMVYSRLSRRIRALGLQNFAQYCDLIQSEAGEEEAGNLVNAITTNLTKFFREDHHFSHLKEVLTKTLSSAPKHARLRIWSAGCSSGMETYSIAMVLRSVMDATGATDVKILATDIDTNMLATGEKGEYSLSEFEHIPEGYRQFVTADKSRDVMIVSDRLKELIHFKTLNLLEKWPMSGPFDVVFCRNVVIYFDKPTQKVLFSRFADMLKPSGWLYIGHSENLQGVCSRFSLTGRTIYKRVQ